MGCGRVPTASAAAAPARAPARPAGSSAKWAASHSSMQPKSCRFNRTPALGVIAECGETVESHARNALIGRTLYHKGGVGASKTERVRQRHIDLALARLLRDEVDRRLDRRLVEIDGRRRDVVADRQNAENRLYRPGRAEQMAVRGLRRRHRDLGSR